MANGSFSGQSLLVLEEGTVIKAWSTLTATISLIAIEP